MWGVYFHEPFFFVCLFVFSLFVISNLHRLISVYSDCFLTIAPLQLDQNCRLKYTQLACRLIKAFNLDVMTLDQDITSAVTHVPFVSV